ncbi:MAG: hypothetical protein IH614_12700 [Desulfuromonadales bacterium]|nr:hypothetical protein [Desulfuromonadales bacterium]
MGAKISNCMTLLGICSMAFYAIMMSLGLLSVDLMPQFLVSSVIFLTSGRIMRKAGRAMVRDEAEEEEAAPPRLTAAPADWPWLTGLLNWTGALLIIGIMAIFLMKPIGISLQEALSASAAHEQFFATAVP